MAHQVIGPGVADGAYDINPVLLAGLPAGYPHRVIRVAVILRAQRQVYHVREHVISGVSPVLHCLLDKLAYLLNAIYHRLFAANTFIA